MNKNTLFTIFSILIILAVVLILIMVVSGPKGEAKVITDKEEYQIGGTLKVKIENPLEEEVCFSTCYPYYLENKEEGWKSYDYQSCQTENVVDSCVDPKEMISFELVVPEVKKGIHRLAIPACVGCRGGKEFIDKEWFYSNDFLIK